MSEDLTLEKLKVDDRLRSVELQLGKLCSHIESEQGNHTRIMNDFNDMIKKLNTIVIGNGKIGIIGRLDILEKGEQERKGHFKIIWGTLCTFLIKILYDGWHWLITKG
jgi:hypothetical protein